MNDDLKRKLEAQRKWRTSEPVSVKAARGRKGWTTAQKIAALFIGVLVVSFVLFFFAALRKMDSRSLELNFTSAPVTESEVTGTENVTPAKSQEPTTMTACTGGDTNGKLHVRIEPGLQGEVRGYLTEGETVIVPLGEQNEPITQIVDDVSWTIIQFPINGWVSASHLCK